MLSICPKERLTMKVFLLQPSFRNGGYAYESLWPVNDANRMKFWRFRCTPKAHQWDLTQVVVAPSRADEPAGDFPYLTTGCLVLSERASSSLKQILSDCGELLPLQCTDGRAFTLCNPYPCHDFLDQDKSLGERFPDGSGWLAIERFCFRRDAVPSAAVFKLIDDARRIFCSLDFKHAVEAAGLAGLWFREVWNDDGDPVETIKFLDFLN
jgi:hypothetical protein